MCNASGRTFVASPIMTQREREREREREIHRHRQTESRTAKGSKTAMQEGLQRFGETGSRRNALFTPCPRTRVWLRIKDFNSQSEGPLGVCEFILSHFLKCKSESPLRVCEFIPSHF
jgi:hypothetical protein